MSQPSERTPEWALGLPSVHYEALMTETRAALKRQGMTYEMDEAAGRLVFTDGPLKGDQFHMQWILEYKVKNPRESWGAIIDTLLEAQIENMRSAKERLALPYDQFAPYLRLILANELDGDTFAAGLVPGLYTVPVFWAGEGMHSISGDDLDQLGVEPDRIWSDAAGNTIRNLCQYCEKLGEPYPPTESITAHAEFNHEVATMVLAPRAIYADWAEFGFLAIIRETDNLFLMPVHRNMEERHWAQVKAAVAKAKFHPSPLWLQPDGPLDLADEDVQAEFDALPIPGPSPELDWRSVTPSHDR